jgi:hypothetical protein
MSIKSSSVHRPNFEAQLTDFASAGVRIAKRVLLRSAIMIAGNVATPQDLARLINQQDQTPEPSRDVEVGIRKAEVIKNCEAAFSLALEEQLHSDDNYILPSPDQFHKSEYICIVSEKDAPLFLHRPTVNQQHLSKHPFWLRERVTGDEYVLGLPTSFFKEYGIDVQGNIEERELLSRDGMVDRLLEPYDSLPYYRALTPVKIRTMSAAL